MNRETTPNGAWRWVGWFGLALTVVGLADFGLTWFPLNLGSAEWEFGTIAASFSGLPLVTMGFAALLGSAIARGVRWQLTGMGLAALALGLLVGAALVLFALVVPVALGAVEGPGRIGVMKAIIRTTSLGFVFCILYLGSDVGSL